MSDLREARKQRQDAQKQFCETNQSETQRATMKANRLQICRKTPSKMQRGPIGMARNGWHQMDNIGYNRVMLSIWCQSNQGKRTVAIGNLLAGLQQIRWQNVRQNEATGTKKGAALTTLHSHRRSRRHRGRIRAVRGVARLRGGIPPPRKATCMWRVQKNSAAAECWPGQLTVRSCMP